jgi:uncharacterized protein (DUF305 family)
LPGPSAASPEATAELEALYRARADSALLRFTEADAAFMTQMIGHHAQALVMAGFAPTRAASPSIRTLAARVTNAQQDEIATMQRWLGARGRPVPVVNATTGATSTTAHTHAGPGMLTPDELQRLERAGGADFDRLFLTLMIRHHEGAISMVHDLFAIDGAASDPTVFKIASDIQVDQRTEVARMQRMLDEMPDTLSTDRVLGPPTGSPR